MMVNTKYMVVFFFIYTHLLRVPAVLIFFSFALYRGTYSAHTRGSFLMIYALLKFFHNRIYSHFFFFICLSSLFCNSRVLENLNIFHIHKLYRTHSKIFNQNNIQAKKHIFFSKHITVQFIHLRLYFYCMKFDIWNCSRRAFFCCDRVLNETNIIAYATINTTVNAKWCVGVKLSLIYYGACGKTFFFASSK